jgi:hypothetical protein
MSISRRDFMKLVGVSVASLTLTRCRFLPVTCYAPMPPSPYPTDPQTARDRLRACWLRFDELVQKTQEESTQGVTENTFDKQLVSEHRAALDELVATGELTPAVADLVQEAYDAAIYHLWRSNVLITCYITAGPYYAPESASVIVQQSEILSQLASQGTIDPETLAKAQAALEHDMAFYALTEEDLQTLYERLGTDGQPYPSFEDVELEVTPEVKAAAKFILDVLTGK